MSQLSAFVHKGDATQSAPTGDTKAAPRQLNPKDFYANVPKSHRGTHGAHRKSQRATTPAQSDDDAPEVNYADRYDGSELGSTGDTTTNLTQDLVQQSQEQPNFGQPPQYGAMYQPNQYPKSGARQPFQPFQATKRVVKDDDVEGLGPPPDGGNSGVDDERDDTHFLTYMHNGKEVTVWRSEEPEQYVRIYAILNQQRLQEQAEAESAVRSYPTTTTGEPSIAPEHSEQDQHPEQHGMDSLPARPYSQPDAHQMPPPQHLPNKTTQAMETPFIGQSQPVHRDQEMRSPAMSFPKDTRAYTDLAMHQHQAPPVSQTRQRQHAPTKINGARTAKTRSPPQINARKVESTQPITATSHGQTEFEPGLLTPTKSPKHKHKYCHQDARPVPLEEVKPDYDDRMPKQKTFGDLQRENYDVDPRAQTKGHRKLKEKELHKKLEELLIKDRPQQKQLLHSLDIAEWDQAGDWFLDRFADLFQRFRKQRSERRSLSLGFEEEIAKRHEVVSKKRKITEDELSGMKVSGQTVLDTPKKMRKHL